MDDEHDIKTDMYFETDFPCEICGKQCRSEEDLSYHLHKHEFAQNVNSDEVKTCQYFMDGYFEFDNECWFNHPELSKVSSVSRSSKPVKC